MNSIEYSEIKKGQELKQTYRVTHEVYDGFISCFKDKNILHVDDSYALKNGFRSRVMHGGILNGFLSHFIGEIFPGEKSLLLTTQIEFLKPVYMDAELELQAKVLQTIDAVRTIVLDYTFFDLIEKYAVARGQIKVKVRQ
jgi:3-hydroxybutyryl-CoA dehydratase